MNFQDQDETDRRDDPQPQADQPAGESGSGAEQPTNGSPAAAEVDQPSDTAPSLEQLVLVLRDQLADLRFKIDAFPQGPGTGPGAPQVAAIRGELSAHGDQLARLAAGLAEHQEDLARREEALVGRIADLDDDRRAAATMLQRAWDSFRADVEARVRRGSSQTIIGLVVLALLFLGGLFLVYRQVGLDRASLAQEVAAVKVAMSRGPQGANLDSLMEGKLKQLAATVRDISDSLKAPAQPQPDLMTALAKERADRSRAEARLADALHSLEGRQRALSARIGSDTGASTEGKSERAAKSPQAVAQATVDDSGAAGQSRAAAKASSPVPAAAGEKQTSESPTPASAATAQRPEAPAAAADEPLVVSDRSYVVQLIGLNGLDDVERFTTRAGLPPTVYYMKQGSKAHPIYVVIHSVHDTRAAAQAAASALPTDLARLRPFVHSVPAGAKLWPCHAGKCAQPER